MTLDRVRPATPPDSNLIPCLRAHLVRTPAVSALAIYLSAILARIQTEGAATLAFAVLRATLATVSSSLLRRL